MKLRGVTSAGVTSRFGLVDAKFRPSASALTVLSLLVMGPLHPYGMQRLIKQWGKDQVVNVGQRANLYKTIKRLQEAGLIAVRQTERDQQYPERTVYELTEEGRQAARQWLADMLSHPRNEFPEFPAALSFMMLLAPDEALATLEKRATQMGENLAKLESQLEIDGPNLPRVVLVETEYQRAVVAAEVGWLTAVTEDLRSGALTWSFELLMSYLPG
jgi:DNA-binding PadR family transcriptional regulator